MKRRSIYISAIVVFVPIMVWYVSRYAGPPKVTFQEAHQMQDSLSKYMVTGTLDVNIEIQEDARSLVFFMVDRNGEKARVVYDGTKEIRMDQMKTIGQRGAKFTVAGHLCNDSKGERFHAKNIIVE